MRVVLVVLLAAVCYGQSGAGGGNGGGPPGTGTVTGGACPAGQYTTGVTAPSGVPVCSPVAFSQLSGVPAFLTSFTDHSLLVGNGTTYVNSVVPLCTALDKALHYNTATHGFTCDTLSFSGGGGITSLGGLTVGTQTFAKVDDTNVTLAIASSVSTHTYTLGWTGTLAKVRQYGGTVYIDQPNTYSAGAKQSVGHSAGAAGFNLIPAAGAPATPVNGDMWYSSDDNKFKCRQNGATADCIATGGGSGITGLTATRIPKALTSTTLDDSNLSQSASGALTFGKSFDGPLGTITFSTTPTLDLSLANHYSLALTGNVTSWTVTNAPTASTSFTMTFTQDATGGRTVAAPTGFVGFDAPDASPNAVTVQRFDKAGSSYYGRASRCLANCGTGYVELLKGATVTTPATNYLKLFWNASKVLMDVDDGGAFRSYPTTTGNIATATALATNGANCAAGSYARGVDASGAAEDCTVAGGGSAASLSTCFLFTNCGVPQISNRAILVTAAQSKGVVMAQVYFPGPLVLNKWVYYQMTGGASTDGTTVGIYADSGSDTPGAMEARFVNGDSSGQVQKTGTWAVGGGSTIAAGLHWIAISSEGVLAQYYGSGESGLSLSPYILLGFVASVPRMVSCSNPSTGTGSGLTLPATCGTATALTTNGMFMPAVVAAR
jgi:hypothetical protein